MSCSTRRARTDEIGAAVRVLPNDDQANKGTRGERHDRYLHLRRLFHPRRLRRRQRQLDRLDRVQVTLFPVITGQTGLDPIFQGAADFDLELVENQTLDDHIQELIYRPTLH
jgi:hypothetical protein